ncbi:MAG: hypothetical protein P8106_11835 [Gammaproteobacteria bacterium]
MDLPPSRIKEKTTGSHQAAGKRAKIWLILLRLRAGGNSPRGIVSIEISNMRIEKIDQLPFFHFPARYF